MARGSHPRSTAAGLDDGELALAARELAGARQALASAHALVDRRERREAVKSAVGRLALAARAIGTVVDRRSAK